MTAISLSAVFLDDAAMGKVARGPTAEICLAEYSRFKHGDMRPLGDYARAMLDLISESRVLIDDSEVVVMGPATGVTPSAATYLSSSVLEHLRPRFNADPAFARRDRDRSGDVYTYPVAAAAKLLADNTEIRGVAHRDQRSVIVVDDIRVSGRRELAMYLCLRRLQVSTILFLYLIRWTGSPSASVERSLNWLSIAPKDHLSLGALARQPDFHPTARFCKALCGLPEIHRNEVLSCLSSEQLHLVRHWIVTDNLMDVVEWAP